LDWPFVKFFDRAQPLRQACIKFLLALANVGCEFKLMKTLEKVSCSYATEDLRHRADNVVWQVRAEGQWVYLYILIEFQSTGDEVSGRAEMTVAGTQAMVFFGVDAARLEMATGDLEVGEERQLGAWRGGWLEGDDIIRDCCRRASYLIGGEAVVNEFLHHGGERPSVSSDFKYWINSRS
jgi:hypothetical protein